VVVSLVFQRRDLQATLDEMKASRGLQEDLLHSQEGGARISRISALVDLKVEQSQLMRWLAELPGAHVPNAINNHLKISDQIRALELILLAEDEKTCRWFTEAMKEAERMRSQGE
jgi:hypothetical protein